MQGRAAMKKAPPPAQAGECRDVAERTPGCGSDLPATPRERRWARWYAAHREERRAYLAAWKANNRDKILAANRRYVQKHRARIRRYSRNYKREERQRQRALRVQATVAGIRQRWREAPV